MMRWLPRQPTLIHLAVMIVLIFAVGFGVAALLLSPARLTSSQPVIRLSDDVMVVLTAGERARVSASVTPFEEAFGPEISGGWRAALVELPTYLTPHSAVYEIKTQGPGEVSLAFNLPPNTDPLSFAVFRFEEADDAWVFVPSAYDPAYNQLRAAAEAGLLALFQYGPVPFSLGATVEPGGTAGAEESVLLNMMALRGTFIEADGSLNAESLERPLTSAVIYPVIELSRDAELDGMIGRGAAINRHVEALVTFALENDYPGLILDYGVLGNQQGDDFLIFLKALDREMDREELTLGVWLPTPDKTPSEWHPGNYDWAESSVYADLLLVRIPGSPGDYVDGGLSDSFLRWAVGSVPRDRLVLVTSSLSVDDWADQRDPISYEYALAPLGKVRYAPEIREVALSPEPGETLRFNLDGSALSIRFDPNSGAYNYLAFAGGAEHTVWLTTGPVLSRRLEWLSRFNSGGIVIEHFMDEGNAAGILPAVETFRRESDQAVEDPTLSLRWTVEDTSGTLLTESTTDLTTSLEWTPEREGEYIVRAALLGDSPSDRGAAAVIVAGESFGVVSAQEGVVTGTPVDSPTATASANLNLPPPVYPPGVAAAGPFELGGQVNHVIANPQYMTQAGMNWVKFQIAWEPNMQPEDTAVPLIEQARANGFKVLLSIAGQQKYPTSIDYIVYVNYLERVAFYGPDAIEVWNENNIDFEWPRGQINGATYVERMLAPAYNAIKSVNPDVMVISGALAPTGAFFADGGCDKEGRGCDDWLYLNQMAEAGAADYMDCVGTHFNAGATSPYATTGHPADGGYQHYSWYFGSMVQLYGGTFGLPVCFTELGYLSGDGYGTPPQRFSWASNIRVVDQARWLGEAARYSLELGDVRMLIVWNVDFWYWGEDPMAGYAIVRPDGSCPACITLADVMQ